MELRNSGSEDGGAEAALGAVFEPDESDEDEVKEGEEDKTDASGEGETVELVGDKAGEDEDGDGVGPEAVAEQGGNDGDLDDAVGEQVDGHEVLAGERETGGGVSEPVCDEVVGVFGDFVLGEEVDGGGEEAGADEPEGDGPEDFQQGVEALEEDAETEEKFAETGTVLEEGGKIHGMVGWMQGLAGRAVAWCGSGSAMGGRCFASMRPAHASRKARGEIARLWMSPSRSSQRRCGAWECCFVHRGKRWFHLMLCVDGNCDVCDGVRAGA